MTQSKPGEMENSEIFLLSALTEENPYLKTSECLQWIEDQKRKITVDIRPIPFSKLINWSFNSGTGDLEHASGKFYTITGLRVRTNFGVMPEWEQPIINQNEVGFLGMITRQVNGVLYFLLQAKCEPGNINDIQLGPSLQATESNFTRVHRGKGQIFLQYFAEEGARKVWYDQLQSEQGSRFLSKRNRNMIIEISDDFEAPDNYCWLTIGQIKQLMRHSHVINMDARSVISTIRYGSCDQEGALALIRQLLPKEDMDQYRTKMLLSSLLSDDAMHSMDEIEAWFTVQKKRFVLEAERIPLRQVRGWVHDDWGIHHPQQKHFTVMAVDATIDNREVPRWTQPMVKPTEMGINAFIVKEIEGVMHVLVQAKLEAGNLDVVEMGPTVQCLVNEYHASQNHIPTFLAYVMNAPEEQVRYSQLQSEDGGRFYREANRYMIIEADQSFPVEVPENYIWMTLNQLAVVMKHSNYVNVEARTLVSTVQFM